MGWASKTELGVRARRVRVPSIPVTYRSDHLAEHPPYIGALSGGGKDHRTWDIWPLLSPEPDPLVVTI